MNADTYVKLLVLIFILNYLVCFLRMYDRYPFAAIIVRGFVQFIAYAVLFSFFVLVANSFS